ncbi:hypothetical protein NLM31_29910 [Bradyrhizobium sp. CCGUVB4N]|uniref:hypothetical protein n=1 Tax=Bradyrhizobium sp. CCGUVB4N TaxID=2949631 RepID=UPI0020B1F068|nr:hypothetical protein [Bradyrhizobium sp. CCGUVB4N]MCP3384596.1 hypothetical protein [Bradyrhizobium sp. CCGUVB4N]
MGSELNKKQSLSLWACRLTVLGAAVFYLAQWLQMPLYPDEVAFRILKARYLADGVQEYLLFPQCLSTTRGIPLLLRPVAYSFSAFDFSFGWLLIREIPTVGVILAMAAALMLLRRDRAPAATLLVTAGFIGVAGAGLVLFRMETALLYYGAACVAGYALLQRDNRHPILVGLYLAVSTVLGLFAFFTHLQSLVLAPIGILIATGLFIKQRLITVRIFAGLCVACIATGALVSSKVPALNCPGLPGVERFVDVMTLPGLAKQEGPGAVSDYLADKLNKYQHQFLFEPTYEHGYLPGTETDKSKTLYVSFNVFISVLVVLNLLIACCLFIYAGIEIVRRLVSNEHSVHAKALLLVTVPQLYLFLAIAGHLGLFFIDVPTNFYRAFYINFALVLINAMALGHIRGFMRLALWPIGGISLAVCVLSASLVLVQFKPKFVAGWSGPSIPLDTDWNAVRSNVTKIVGKCGIRPQEARIFIDDMTFDAMKGHPHLMPITYLGVAYDPKDPGAKTPEKFIRSFGATYVLARCIYLPIYKIDPDVRMDDLCCAKL